MSVSLNGSRFSRQAALFRRGVQAFVRHLAAWDGGEREQEEDCPWHRAKGVTLTTAAETVGYRECASELLRRYEAAESRLGRDPKQISVAWAAMLATWVRWAEQSADLDNIPLSPRCEITKGIVRANCSCNTCGFWITASEIQKATADQMLELWESAT